MVSSASAQIEASGCISPSRLAGSFSSLLRFIAGGEHSRTTIQTPTGPKDVPNYALVQGIFIGVVAAYVIVLALIGPENHGSHFERGKTAFQVGASKEDVRSLPGDADGIPDAEKSSFGSAGREKGDNQHVEQAKSSLA